MQRLVLLKLVVPLVDINTECKMIKIQLEPKALANGASYIRKSTILLIVFIPAIKKMQKQNAIISGNLCEMCEWHPLI